MMKWAVLAVLLFVPACPAWSQEVSVFLGLTQQADPDDHSASAQIEYKGQVGRRFAWSLSYLNEGHFPEHHRDGGAGQFWVRTNALSPQLYLDAGIGPYYYFDTVRVPGDGYANDHGWGMLASIGAAWHTQNHWLLQLRGNWVEAGRNIDRFSVMFGVGYQLASPAPDRGAERQDHETTKNEITLFLGRAILNSFGSENATAASVEYRRRLWQYVDWTASWLYEGHNSMITRNGFITQLWGVKEFFEDRLSLGAGAGVYRAVDLDSVNRKDNNRFFSGVISFTGSYRFHRHWDMRVLFDRIITDYNKDSDVILGGIGYRF
jgi:hypothetical protein